MNEPNDLLAAVDRLTKPEKTAHWVSSHVHSWERCECQEEGCDLWLCKWCDETSTSPASVDDPEEGLMRRVDAPLLDRLRMAVVSSVGGTGGGKQARERTPMDVGAFTLYEDIDGRVRSWLDSMGERHPGLSAVEALRRWYVLWIAQPRTDDTKASYASTLDGWAGQIRDKLDSPKRIEITAPCPSCGEEWVNIGLKLENGEDDPDDVERVRALAAVERETIDESYAMCAACKSVWMGVGRMRSLRIAIDDAESAAKATVIA